MKQEGFIRSKCDYCLYYKQGLKFYVLLYVDDIISILISIPQINGESIMIDPDNLTSLKENDPFRRYHEASQNADFMRNDSGGSGWSWRDSYLEKDFNKLKGEPDSISTSLVCLKSFYLMYFGEIGTTTNLGALLEQIIVRSPSFTSEKDSLVLFNSSGTVPPTPYTPPSILATKFDAFMKTTFTPENTKFDISGTTPPPEETIKARLVGTKTTTPEFESKSAEVSEPENILTTDQDFITFKSNVQTAFRTVITSRSSSSSEGEGSSNNTETASMMESASAAFRSLHLTATYISLVMLRRITKRDTDLIAAFGRQNIHRHYTDMVPQPLGLAIPPPSYSFNAAMSSAVSVSTEAGRHIGTILLYLMKSCTAAATDKPVGFLDQERIGLEAILKATCMTHIAGTGLPLATLFVTVRSLYNKSEWDTIKWLSYRELQHSITTIINMRLDHYAIVKEGQDSVKLFPYCRLVHQKYHPDLGYKGNEEMCFLLACLVDLKSVPKDGTGGAKSAMWTHSMNEDLKREIEIVAKSMYSESSAFNLSPIFKGQIAIKSSSHPGQTWKLPENVGKGTGEEGTTESEKDLVPW